MFGSRGKLRGRVKLAYLEILQSCGVEGSTFTKINYTLSSSSKTNSEVLLGLHEFQCARLRFIKLKSARPISSRNQQIASIRAQAIKPVLNTGVRQIKTSAITKNGESLEMSFQ